MSVLEDSRPRAAAVRVDCNLPSAREALTAAQSECIEHAIAVLSKVSRTFQGESNVESSPDKERLLKIGDELAMAAQENFRNAVSTLFALRNITLDDPVQIKQLIGVVGLRLNEGLMPATRSFWRSWETPFAHQLPPGEIKAAMSEKFCPEFLRRWNDPEEDPVRFAVWVERTLNAEIHPLSDGCGKLTKALSTCILGSAGIKFPDFESRDDYFEMLLSPTADEAERKYRSRIH